MIQKLSQAFSVTCRMAKLMIKLIKYDSDYEIGTVQTGRKFIHLAAEKVTTVHVRACSGIQFRGQSLLFVPCGLPDLPEGVTVKEGLVTVTTGKSMYVPVPIMNTNKYDITMNPHTVLGHLQAIKTAYAVQSEQLPTLEQEKEARPPVNLTNGHTNEDEKQAKPVGSTS